MLFVLTNRRKEGNVLFNDALNTFYLRLYGVRYMVKDHSDSETGNPLLPHGLLFPISTKGSFIYISERIAHTMTFVTPVVEHWLELKNRKANMTKIMLVILLGHLNCLNVLGGFKSQPFWLNDELKNKL